MRGQAGRDEFLFLGDHLALDFLNTRPVLKRQEQERLTGFHSLLRWFVHARLLDRAVAEKMAARWIHRPEAGAALSQILAFRERFRAAILALEVSGEVPRHAMDQINRLLRLHTATFQVVKAGRSIAKKIVFPAEKPGDLLGILASLVADLFAEVPPRRIRKCEGCVLHFRDTTKNGTRRWCNMQACGNRAKVAAYTARRRRRQGA
jgi:predicted RNA-binding Zn ribbon-like protein